MRSAIVVVVVTRVGIVSISALLRFAIATEAQETGFGIHLRCAVKVRASPSDAKGFVAKRPSVESSTSGLSLGECREGNEGVVFVGLDRDLLEIAELCEQLSKLGFRGIRGQ